MPYTLDLSPDELLTTTRAVRRRLDLALMLGSTGRPADGIHDAMKPGTRSGLRRLRSCQRDPCKVLAAGAEITVELHDTDFGSHTFSLRDTEGNAWTIGT